MTRRLSALLSLVLLLGAADAWAQEPKPQADGPLVVRTGAAGGAVQLTVFCDLEEEACQRLVVILRRVVETYPEQVGVTFRHHAAEGHTQSPLAYRSALAAARQGRGWELLDMACANPDRLIDAGLRSMAAQLQLDLDKFVSDTDAVDVAQRLDDDGKEAEALKVAGVPAVLLNGTRLPDASTFDAIDAAIRAAIK
jgi:predicted DsbA family dithiol-disulfide isomerase